MKTLVRILMILAIGVVPLLFPTPALAFRFVSWADTKSGTATLTTLSQQAAGFDPVFTVYPGDVCDSGPDATCFPIWKNALNGGGTPGNGMFTKTFATRGNHDAAGTTFWTSNYNVAGVAAAVGATNVSQLNTNLTYSFDYGNSHFIGADVPGGDVSTLSSAIISWIDQDLTAAEQRPGIVHAFIFFHGPVYYVDGHASTAPANLITVLNKHPIVSATFHGHEHVMAYVHLDNTRISTLTHPFEEFVTGGAGADLYTCTSGRSDYCTSQDGFDTIDVNGNSFTVNIYVKGNTTPVKSYTFTKGTATATPTATPTPTPTRTPTPTPTPTGTQNGSYQPSAPFYATFFYNWYMNPATDGSGQWGLWKDSDALGTHNPSTNWHSNFLPEPTPGLLNTTAGLYSSNDYNNFKWQVGKLKEAKQSVAIASWWGQGDRSDVAFGRQITDFMNRTDNPYPSLRWAIYYECEGGVCNGTSNPSVAQLVSDLNYIASKYVSQPGYLKINGKPVIFVYGDAADTGTADTTCTDSTMEARWYQANQQASAKFYINLKVFNGFSATACKPDSWHQYSPAVRSDQQGSYSYAVSPGFWQVGTSVRLVRDVSAFTSAVKSMVAADTTWKLITTWNEWAEGTGIEPAAQVVQANGTGTATADASAPAFGNAYIDALRANLPALPSTTPAPVPGDLNGDTHVNIFDYNILISYFGHPYTIFDYNIVVTHFGT